MLTRDSNGIYVRIEETNDVGAVVRAIYLVDGEPVPESELKHINFHRFGIITSDFETAN